jgi:hypothetical protein
MAGFTSVTLLPYFSSIALAKRVDQRIWRFAQWWESLSESPIVTMVTGCLAASLARTRERPGLRGGRAGRSMVFSSATWSMA